MGNIDIVTNNPVLLTHNEFTKLSELLQRETGIKLPPSKKIMIMTRLSKRLKELGIDSFSNYFDYLQTIDGKQTELEQAINAISTNKTEFFRENQQFDYLEKQVIPEMVKSVNTLYKSIDIWSAGCSSGQEPYSLAMVLENYKNKADLRYSILATDISTKVLDKAKLAIYSDREIATIPHNFQKQYLLKGKNTYTGSYQINHTIKRNVTFQKHNLMIQSFQEIGQMDIIFCRNVIIYFDRDRQQQLIDKFHDTLRPGGYLFIGASETLFNTKNMFNYAGPNIYQKKKR